MRPEIPEIQVPPGDDNADGEELVHICKAFTEEEFLFTAQIEGADADDPIVIIEK